MPDLGPQIPADTYSFLLQVDGGLTGSAQFIEDGIGNISNFGIGLSQINIDCGVCFGITNTTGSPPFSLNLNKAAKMYHWVNPAGGTATVNLPVTSAIEDFRYFRVKNNGGSGSVVVKNSGGTTLATLTAGQNAEFIMNPAGPAWEKV